MPDGAMSWIGEAQTHGGQEYSAAILGHEAVKVTVQCYQLHRDHTLAVIWVVTN